MEKNSNKKDDSYMSSTTDDKPNVHASKHTGSVFACRLKKSTKRRNETRQTEKKEKDKPAIKTGKPLRYRQKSCQRQSPSL